jgi:alcohol dehydrogenase (NADP+)
MKTVSFQNGDLMPALGLGTWKSHAGEVGEAVKIALELGYRHIDCAAIYGNEAEIGEALSMGLASGSVRRDDLWITSKLWNSSHGNANVIPALQKTLTDLRLDYLDLYLIHWPVAIQPGLVLPHSSEDFIDLADLPLSDTWAGMEAAQAQGLCRHIGVSNFSIKKLKGLYAAAQHPPELNQIELHPYLQQHDMLEFCRDMGVFLTAYSPLGSRDRPELLKVDDEPILLDDPVVLAIAASQGCTPAQVLLAWALQRGTLVIPKSIHRGRLSENLAAAEITLSTPEMMKLASLDRHRRYVSGSFWATEGSPYTLENLWDEPDIG